jgi:hypothetical protein
MHVTAAIMLLLSFGIKDCNTYIYSPIFMCCIVSILVHQAFDIYLHTHNYLVDFDNCPPMSLNKLRFNKELFEAQTSMLFMANIVFGLLSLVTIGLGVWMMITENNPETSNHLVCLHGNEWGYVSFWGMVFGTAHQIMVLMQINISQYIIVRIPYDMGIFDRDQKHATKIGLIRALQKSISNANEKEDVRAQIH